MSHSSPTPLSTPEQWREGIVLFNRGEFFECHEALEAVWLQTIGPDKRFLQGLIQVAVAFYHLRRGNFAGASRLLRAGLDKLSQPHAAGIPNLDELLEALNPLPQQIATGVISPDRPAPRISC